MMSILAIIIKLNPIHQTSNKTLFLSINDKNLISYKYYCMYSIIFLCFSDIANFSMKLKS